MTSHSRRRLSRIRERPGYLNMGTSSSAFPRQPVAYSGAPFPGFFPACQFVFVRLRSNLCIFSS